MAKVITEYTPDMSITNEQPKMVEIKHTTTMKDASGNDVEVVDYVDTKSVDEAISQCEAVKARLQEQLTECEAELTEYIAIRDAE